MTPGESQAESGTFATPALAAVVAASMVGAGVWTTSGYALAALGTPGRVLVVWAAGGLVALCGAAAYGGLAAAVRGSGGEYLFLARVVHPFAGFLAGWVSLLAGFTAAAAFAAGVFEEYLRPVLPGGFDAVPAGLLGSAAILCCGALHALSAGGGTRAQTAAVAAKLGLLAAFAAFAAVKWSAGGFAGGPAFPAEPPAGAPRGWGLARAGAEQLVWVSLSYSGFNAAVYVAGEARDARRSVPRAMLWATAAVAGLYVALNAAFVLAPPRSAVLTPAGPAGDVAAVAAAYLGGDALAWAVRAVVCAACLTSVSALVQTGPRVYARMAADGLFPLAGRLAPRADGSAPASAVWLQAAAAAALCPLAGVRGLLDYLGLTLSLSAAGAVGCLFLLKRRGEPVAAWRLAAAAAFASATVGLAAVTLLSPAFAENPRGDAAGSGLALLLTVAAGAAAYLPLARGTAAGRPAGNATGGGP